MSFPSTSWARRSSRSVCASRPRAVLTSAASARRSASSSGRGSSSPGSASRCASCRARCSRWHPDAMRFRAVATAYGASVSPSTRDRAASTRDRVSCTMSSTWAGFRMRAATTRRITGTRSAIGSWPFGVGTCASPTPPSSQRRRPRGRFVARTGASAGSMRLNEVGLLLQISVAVNGYRMPVLECRRNGPCYTLAGRTDLVTRSSERSVVPRAVGRSAPATSTPPSHLTTERARHDVTNDHVSGMHCWCCGRGGAAQALTSRHVWMRRRS